jgi:hypothetical protein
MSNELLKTTIHCGPLACLCGYSPEQYCWGEYQRHECPLMIWNWVNRRGVHADLPPIEWLNHDSRYWKELRKETIRLGIQLQGTTTVAHIYRRPADTNKVWKAILKHRYDQRCEEAARHLESPVAQYGAVMGGWVQDQIDSAYRSVNDPCIDNTRWGRIRNSCDMRRYKRAKDHGCCGRYDTVVEHPKYGKFVIGFNYGH